MSTAQGKDTIYIDVDDEITTIIDKVRSSHERIVALVLPKRATVFQSIVNMKLLKRTADEAKKHLVLITSEAGLLPLAGNVGIYVAKTLQSRPEIPEAPGNAHHDHDEGEEAVDMNDADEKEDKLDPTRSIGSYAAGAGGAMVPDDDDQPIELDDDTPTPTVGEPAGKKHKYKAGSGGKFRIPDFNKFRLWIVLGVVGIGAVIFIGYLMFVVMPRASVAIKTDSQAVSVNTDISLVSNATSVQPDKGVVPAVVQQTQKTLTQQVDATGQQDNGTKATGQVTLSLKDCSQDQVTIPAGTGPSANGNTYITQEAASLTSIKIGGQCRNSDFPSISSKTVNVSAQANGDKYNAAATTYTVVNFSNVGATGTAMAGGTSQIVKVISQADIDSANQKIGAQDTSAVKSELTRALQSQSLFVIDSTFNAGSPETSASGKVGDQAASVTVTQKITYSMIGVQQSDLQKIVANAVNGKIDPNKQSILDYGLSGATFKVNSQQGQTTNVSLDSTVIAGTDINVADIRKQVAGKKSADAKDLIGKYPGVTDVNVSYSPFWVSAIPKQQSKITVTVEKPSLSNAKKQ